ncbi:MAG: DUF1320 domain-containing protein [Blastomonas sp.]
MPLFASLADMQARFEAADLVQLTDEDGLGVIDAARIERALGKADAIITGYVASRHADSGAMAGNNLLTEIACDLCWFELWRTDPPDLVKDKRKAAIAQLVDIAAGRIKLDSGQEEQDARPGQLHFGTSDRKLGRESLGGF